MYSQRSLRLSFLSVKQAVHLVGPWNPSSLSTREEMGCYGCAHGAWDVLVGHMVVV